jgi:hypothetical protein
MKVFNIRINNHEEHEGHEEKCVKNFVFSATAPALLNHRDVAAAIAPGNLAAFPPSLEVNAAYAGAVFCLPLASMQSSVFFVVNIAFGVS